MPIKGLHSSNSTITLFNSGAKPQTKLGSEVAETVKSASLNGLDTYIRSTNLLEGTLFGFYNSYQNTTTAVDNLNKGRAAVDFTNVGQSVMRSAIQRSVTASVRNTVGVIKGDITVAEGAGRVVGDVAQASSSAAVSALATNAAVFAVSKLGGGSLPIMAAGMIGGFVADRALGYVMVKYDVQQKITTGTTDLLNGIGNNQAAEK